MGPRIDHLSQSLSQPPLEDEDNRSVESVKILSEMDRRIDAFKADFRSNSKLSHDAVLFTTKSGRQYSELDKHGVRVVHNQDVLFFCLLGNCPDSNFCARITNGGTSNATNHLRNVHGIVSKKKNVTSHNACRHSNDIAIAQECYEEDPKRFFELIVSAWATEQSISFNSFQSDHFRILSSFFNGPNSPSQPLSLNLRKAVVEQYVAIKGAIKKDLDTAKSYFNSMPFLCLNIDLYKSSLGNQKYLAVRLSWMNKRGMLLSRNIAMRAYSPTYAERKESRSSDIL